MILDEVRHIYFIGIGGIGMSALARYFHALGAVVEGYDKTRTELTMQLESEGIDIHYEDNVELAMKQPDLVVYTPAIPPSMSELVYFQQSGVKLMKRSEVLGLITQHSTTIGVAGTHGKTTTSSIVAHLLNTAGDGCTAFIGGIMRNMNSNLSLASAGKPVVVEADEYDRSFLRLFPTYSVITSVDPDHLDIYYEHDQLLEAFQTFAGQTNKDGAVVICDHVDLQFSHPNQLRYGYQSSSDLHISNVQPASGGYTFSLTVNGETTTDWSVSLPGKHNVENATAAIGVGLQLGLSLADMKNALAQYGGVKRRFEYILKGPKHWLIDDYAHHPSELNSTITTARKLFPNDKIVAVFQPHLFSRTRDFAKGFGSALSQLDELVLLDIYPAREVPIPGINSEMLLSLVDLEQKSLLTKEQLIEWAKEAKPRVLLMLGAGDIDALVQPIKNALLAE